MHLSKMTEQAKKILMDDEVLNLWTAYTSEGVILCHKESQSLIYINEVAAELLEIDGENEPSVLSDLYQPQEIASLLSEKKCMLRTDNYTLETFAALTGKYILLLIKDFTKVDTIQKKSDEIRQLNIALQTVYEQYADDTIFITDGDGNVEFVGAAIPKNCGVSLEYIKGKTAKELEDERIFFPSVTMRVIESKQPEVILQETKLGKRLVTTGNPIYNEKGEITKIISVTKDFSAQIKIGTLLSVVEPSNDAASSDKIATPNIVTCNDKMLGVIELAQLVAVVNSTVLINGETGTGKEVLARYIYNASSRSDQPFIKVNCGAISPTIFESELFGYEPGSFTGANKGGKIGLLEAANGGTLFLDEISELPINQQVKLLQVLQERSMTRVGGTKTVDLDIRIIAATNKDLEYLVEKGEFREDLFYRLNVVPIRIPPLRERNDDIPLLISHFIKAFNVHYGKDKELSKEAFQTLCQYSWPGNVRELENTIERLVITTLTPLIKSSDLPLQIAHEKMTGLDSLVMIKKIVPLSEATKALEKNLLFMAMEKYKSGKKVAEILGVNPSTISRKLRRLHLDQGEDNQ